MAVPFHHTVLPKLGAFLRKHKYACPFHPLPCLRSDAHLAKNTSGAWKCIQLCLPFFFFFKAAFQTLSPGLVIFYRQSNTLPRFSVFFRLSSHLLFCANLAALQNTGGRGPRGAPGCFPRWRQKEMVGSLPGAFTAHCPQSQIWSGSFAFSGLGSSILRMTLH